MRQTIRKLLPAAPIAAAAVALLSGPRHAGAEDATEKAERCANRLSIAMYGETAAEDFLKNANPQSTVDAMVKDAKFNERFSRFINSQFNTEPGANSVEDASYHMSKYVLENDKVWSDMFVGQYDVVNQNNQVSVQANPNGLGYFRSRTWMVRYAGNEPAGIRIVSAYRILQNTLGIELVATTNSPDADISANGRKAAACATCHYNPWFALDHVASVLSTRRGEGDQMQFDPPQGGAKTILGGVSIADDKALVEALVTNEAFDVNACRLAFKYLYGRKEYSCEGPLFDKCVDAFKKDKKIQTAVATVAKDSTFCE